MSNLNEYKDITMKLCRFKGWNDNNVEKIWLLLIEEIGELAGSIRRHNNIYRDRKKVKIEDELGDVFSYLFQIAGVLDIDLNQMWNSNQNKIIHKKYFKDNTIKYNNETTVCRKYTKNGSSRAENRRMVQHT